MGERQSTHNVWTDIPNVFSIGIVNYLEPTSVETALSLETLLLSQLIED